MTTELRFLFYKWYAVWNGFEIPERIVQPGKEVERDEHIGLGLISKQSLMET
jgi:hypothetical protein